MQNYSGVVLIATHLSRTMIEEITMTMPVAWEPDPATWV